MLPDQECANPGEALPEEIVDAVFAISCRCLPVDHAYALSHAIQVALPWLAREPGAGLHTIHGASSGSGWMRPEAPDALLQLSHRARLALRLPRRRLERAAALVGRTLEVAGWPLGVGGIAVRPLSRITTLFSRSVILVDAEDEAAFTAAAAVELDALRIDSGKMVCGRMTPLATPTRSYATRSLLVAGLTREQSLALQQHGLGAERLLGCGLFVPHKAVADLGSWSDNS